MYTNRYDHADDGYREHGHGRVQWLGGYVNANGNHPDIGLEHHEYGGGVPLHDFPYVGRGETQGDCRDLPGSQTTRAIYGA